MRSTSVPEDLASPNSSLLSSLATSTNDCDPEFLAYLAKMIRYFHTTAIYFAHDIYIFTRLSYLVLYHLCLTSFTLVLVTLSLFSLSLYSLSIRLTCDMLARDDGISENMITSYSDFSICDPFNGRSLIVNFVLQTTHLSGRKN